MPAKITVERFPARTIIQSNLVSLLIYGTGIWIVGKTGLIFTLIYLAFVLFMEIRLIRNHCINCYYWGKACGFGKGFISSLFFKKGDPSRFCSKSMSWKELIPDIMISLIPLCIGLVLLIISFNFFLLLAMLLLILLSTAGNSYIRSSLTCKYCKQRELGCPAEQLFSKNAGI